VFTLGPAGTGKTYIAATLAADMLLDEKIERVVLSRPAVGVDEEHGFLPGDINKKIAPWVVPFTEVMQKRMGKDRYRQAMINGQIEIVPIAYMRGRTFDRALVFLDEAQNTTYSQIKMFLTRVGEGAKVIVNGDIRQTDLEGHSGLASVLDMIDKYDLPVPVIEFTNEDVVRSGICKMWAEAFDKKDSSEA
jgi:phosphate starvation-inducible PhoH-like protein